MQYTIENFFLKAIKYALGCSKQAWFEENMSVQSFKIIKVLVLGLSLGSLEKKCDLNVAPTKTHIIYYREGSDASSQRLWTV